MDFSKKSGFLADGKICPMDFEKQYCQNPPWGGFQQYCFSKSIGICCGILKNSTVKVRPEADFKIHPAVLLCQNPSPGTSGGIFYQNCTIVCLPPFHLRLALVASYSEISRAVGASGTTTPSLRSISSSSPPPFGDIMMESRPVSVSVEVT